MVSQRLRILALLPVGLLVGTLFSACGSLKQGQITIVGDDAGGRTNGGAAGTGTSSAGNSSVGGASGNGGEAGEMVVPEAMPGPPTVVAVSPTDQVSGADPTKSVVLHFSEPLDPATVTSDSVQLKDEQGALVLGKVTYKDAIATITPDTRLSLLASYTVSVTTAIQDVDGTALDKAFTSTFTVRDGAWGTEGKLPNTTAPFDRSEIALTSDGHGTALAVWAQLPTATAAHADIVGRFYVPGQGWGPIVTIDQVDATVRAPAASMNQKGDAIAAWSQEEVVAGATQTRVAARRYVQGVWETNATEIDPLAPGSTSNHIDEIGVAMTAVGSAHVTWTRSYDVAGVTEYHTEVRRVDPGGLWDAAPMNFANGSDATSLPSLAFDSAGNGFAIFIGFSSAGWVTHAGRFLESDGNWIAGILDGSDSFNSGGKAAVAVDSSGGAMAVWSRQTASGYDVVASQYAKTWKPISVISDHLDMVLGYYSDPLVAVAWTGKSFLAAWSQASTTVTSINANEFTNGWGKTLILSDGDHETQNPVIGSDPRGNLLVLWPQTALDSLDIRFVRRVAGASTWTAPDVAENTIGTFQTARIAVQQDGSAIAAWSAWTAPGEGDLAGFFDNAFE